MGKGGGELATGKSKCKTLKPWFRFYKKKFMKFRDIYGDERGKPSCGSGTIKLDGEKIENFKKLG